jgi:hypothetical protein
MTPTWQTLVAAQPRLAQFERCQAEAIRNGWHGYPAWLPGFALFRTACSATAEAIGVDAETIRGIVVDRLDAVGRRAERRGR